MGGRNRHRFRFAAGQHDEIQGHLLAYVYVDVGANHPPEPWETRFNGVGPFLQLLQSKVPFLVGNRGAHHPARVICGFDLYLGNRGACRIPDRAEQRARSRLPKGSTGQQQEP